MNNNQHFDENIREQFSNYAPDVHPRIWENIIAKKERRKPVGFWFTLFNSRNILLILGLLLAGASGAWFFFKDSSAPVETKSNNSAMTDKNRSAGNSQTPVPGNNNTGNNANTVTINSTPASNNDNANATDKPFTGTRLNTPSAISVRTFIPSGVSTDEPAGLKDNKKISIVAEPGPIKVNNAVDGLTISEPANGQGSLFGRLLFEAQRISTQKQTKAEIKKRNTPFWLLPDCPAMEKDAAGNKKYIELYAGPDLIIRKMSDTGNSVYLQKRKESTKVSSAYSAGIRYTRVFGNSMSVRAGVNYSQINEKFTFVQGNLVQITYIINASGDTTGSFITRGTRYKTTYNKYRSIDVPLLVGYEVGNGKLHANINAGPVVNIYSWQKGEVLDTTYQPVNITTGKGSSPYQFKTNAGLGFMASASVYYKLNDKLHVMAEPYYRCNFTPMNKDNLTLKQKYNTVGLRLGLRVDLK